MVIPNKLYDILKWVCLVVLPALGTLYFGLSEIWGLPYGQEITGTLSVIAVCIGTIIGISNYSYNKISDKVGGTE